MTPSSVGHCGLSRCEILLSLLLEKYFSALIFAGFSCKILKSTVQYSKHQIGLKGKAGLN